MNTAPACTTGCRDAAIRAITDERDQERTRRLHLAGERDEARSDLRRMHALIEAILRSGCAGPARTAQWREQAAAIAGRHTRDPRGGGTAGAGS